jgi:hypothetical protein
VRAWARAGFVKEKTRTALHKRIRTLGLKRQ